MTLVAKIIVNGETFADITCNVISYECNRVRYYGRNGRPYSVHGERDALAAFRSAKKLANKANADRPGSYPDTKTWKLVYVQR